MRVTAALGLRVPKEENPRQYIEHDPAKPVELHGSSYYLRRLQAGELVLVDEEQPVVAQTQASAKPSARKAKGAQQ